MTKVQARKDKGGPPVLFIDDEPIAGNAQVTMPASVIAEIVVRSYVDGAQVVIASKRTRKRVSRTGPSGRITEVIEEPLPPWEEATP